MLKSLGVPPSGGIFSCPSLVIVILIVVGFHRAAIPDARAQVTSAPATLGQSGLQTPATLGQSGLPGAPAETTYQPETSYQPWMTVMPFSSRKTTDTEATTLIDVDRTVGGVRLRGGLVFQAYKRPGAALLIVPEWYGLNAAIRGEADVWARKGFRVFAFDLYGGAPVRSRAGAARLMKQLDPARVAPGLKAALTLLAGSPEAPTTAPLPLSPAAFKTGVLAFGAGAVCAQRLLAEDPRPAALAMLWGEPVKDPAVLAKIKAPVLAIFAGRDAWVTPEKIAYFRKAMTGAPIPPETLTLMTLPGFLFNTADPVSRGYTETARQRVEAFFNRELVE